MAQIVELTDLLSPGLDVYARLTEGQLRHHREEEMGIFIAESPNVIALALDAGLTPLSMLMERRHIEGSGKALIERCGNIPIYTGERDLLASLTGYALTRGFLCALRRPVLPPWETLCADAHRIAILEGLTDPSNVGAVFRSAAAMGLDAVLVTPDCCDPLHRRAVRVSMGSVFQIPWSRIGDKKTPWPCLYRLRALGMHSAALALDRRSISLEDPVLKEQDRLALLLGSEGNGLRRETISACDFTVRIPMARGVDSLNVAAASAVAFWELRRSSAT